MFTKHISFCLFSRDPFVIPLQSREAALANQARLSMAKGANSDHIALLNAYNGWSSDPSKYRYCRENYLSPAGMNSIRDMRNNLQEQLVNR